MDSFLGDGEVHQIDLIQKNRWHQGTSFLRSVHAEGREDLGTRKRVTVCIQRKERVTWNYYESNKNATVMNFFVSFFCKKSAFLFLHYILSSNPTGFVRKDFLRLKSSSRPNTRSCSKSSQASQCTVHCGCNCIIIFALHPLIYWKLWSLIVRHVHHI